jgi:hypothetical protein
MICPLCKKGRLQRRRTYDKGERVLRASKCDKCHAYTNTIEMTETAYQAERSRHDQETDQWKEAASKHHSKLEGLRTLMLDLLGEVIGSDALGGLLELKVSRPAMPHGHQKKLPGRSRPVSRKISKPRKQ